MVICVLKILLCAYASFLSIVAFPQQHRRNFNLINGFYSEKFQSKELSECLIYWNFILTTWKL